MKVEPASRILIEDPALAERVSVKPSTEPIKKKEQQKRQWLSNTAEEEKPAPKAQE